ncbi:hypothetical protein NFI96_006152 [Prochilodus magdalenae]|nr:hypothetical protein NFI96_006152 [Prochilodus magdalenae]
MEPTASLSILALLLLGLCQAVPLTEPQHVDITAAILTTNTGSSELLVEGDIVIPRTRNALACPDNNCFWKKSWTGLVQVPYTLSADFTFSDRSVIAGAMASFHSKTCIRFVSRTNETDYLSIENRDGDVDNLLPLLSGATLQLGRSGGRTPTTSTHKNRTNDYSSVMHYGKTAFSINGLDTITPIPDASVQIGQRVDLSAIDILRINTLYKC